MPEYSGKDDSTFNDKELMQKDMDSWSKATIEKLEAGWQPHPLKSSKTFASKPPRRAVIERIKVVKIGADIEEFLRDKSGRPIPVTGLIGGTKDKPMPVLREGFALQEDNVALEYNIPPADDKYEWVYSLMRIREEINERVAKLGLVSAVEASMRFEAAQLDNPHARVFGCDPDYNVWEQKVNEMPEVSKADENLRTAGGHVHISFTVDGEKPKHPDHLSDMESVVMACDIHLGVPFTLIDKDRDRLKRYGKAGAFRPKVEYGGIEYRVLSNCWTRSPVLMGYVYDRAHAAVKLVNELSKPREKLLTWKEAVYDAINNRNPEAAKEIMNYFNVAWPKGM